MMTLLAIDLGTSYIKGAVLDLDTLRLAHIRRALFPAALPGLPPLHYEVDPHTVVAAVRALIDALLPHAPDCAGVVMATQMHSLVLADARGAPLTNAITWQDQRALEPHPSGTGSYFDLLVQRLSAAERRQLGNELRPGLPICALFYLAEQGRLPAGSVPMTLADWVIARLCGTQPGTEPTNAAAQGALNLETLDWHHDVLARLGLNRLRWPALRRSGDVVGTARVGGHALPCRTPVGDQQCALVGAALGADELSLNIATGSQVSRISSHLAFGDYQTRPFFDGQFLATITHLPAGRALNLLIRLLSELAEAQQIALPDPWAYIPRAAAAVAETDLQVDLAFFASARGDRGAITNIHEGNLTVGHLFRAAFEHMAGNYHACALRLWPERGWRRLVFSGGLAQQLELLRTIIQQRFQAPYRLSPSTEDTLLGLLALGLAWTGRARSVAAAMDAIQQTYAGAAAQPGEG